MRRLSVLLSALLFVLIIQAQNDDRTARSLIVNYFDSYEPETDISSISVLKTDIDHQNKSIQITLSDNFSRILFRNSDISGFQSDLQRILPQVLKRYDIKIFSNGKDISGLIPNRLREKTDTTLLWGHIRYGGEPLVRNYYTPFSTIHGLNGIHLAVTPSHGYYYDNKEKNEWKWQRPSLWCTREDILTQSFVYPYLIPMLENAGAVVTCMRERDYQPGSYVIDNQSDKRYYQESSSRGNRWTTSAITATGGNATVSTVNCRQEGTDGYAKASWIPEIEQTGYYAVYVTYKTFPNSVTDARYIVHHSGGETTFLVNQQIGGGSWIYLGTFLFEKGHGHNGMIVLDNISEHQGIVCADAVRFGGGTGNDVRGSSTSGMPRYLEGARYYARFNGAPDSVFAFYDGLEEYKEDIQVRPRMSNWLSGGSVYSPSRKGLGIPIELYLALHTDAGIREGDSIVGTLGICSTKEKNGVIGTGISRDVSRDLTDQILTTLAQDLNNASGRKWTIRGIMDDDYCETREPDVPSTLIELLSHQNFYDMKYAFDPNFRFTASRSIYKAILKHVTYMHGMPYTVQPLPVNSFMIERNADGKSIKLLWQPTNDPAEPSARPDGYIVYTSIDGKEFDNGTPARSNSYDMKPIAGHIYSFRVTATNSGGQSMPSETLSAYISPKDKGTVLMVNGFQRLSGPATISTPDCIGFDLIKDEGVQYMGTPIFSGYQKVFDRSHLYSTDEEELGFSGDELIAFQTAGNKFNYPYIHGKAIASEGGYSFVSCSRDAVERGYAKLGGYDLTDIILGLQKRTSNDTIMGVDYTAFTPTLMEIVTEYHENGGNIIISGSYVGSDLYTTNTGRNFANEVLGIKWGGNLDYLCEQAINGINGTSYLNTEPDKDIYRLCHPDIIEPSGNSIAIFTYTNSRYSAGVAHKDASGGIITTGFPLESIKDERQRGKVMSSLMDYLLK